MEKKIVFLIWIFATFLLASYGYDWQRELGLVPESWPWDLRRWLSQVVWTGLPPLLFLWAFYGWKSLGQEWGLQRPVWTAFRFAFLCTLPMLIGYGLLAKGQMSMDWRGFLHGCVLAALMEELLYRGFFFGQLYYRAKWPFLLAALAPAIIFGAQHLYQSSDLASALGIFGVTFLGSFWFAWLYVSWDRNLWVPIFFHFLMNFHWGLFDMSENAMGGLWANVFRIVTIVLSIVLSLRKKTGSQVVIWSRSPITTEPH
ncbi:MAG TPA: type II CAAX endopeptidase family protein [Saprospiraceae bacterium]|nr:type II CAAX endopeptidase family protein [Saprospiraceae bacterium]